MQKEFEIRVPIRVEPREQPLVPMPLFGIAGMEAF